VGKEKVWQGENRPFKRERGVDSSKKRALIEDQEGGEGAGRR